MAPDPVPTPEALARELAALCRTLVHAERERERRLEEKLAELDAWLADATRIQSMITGGASRREARLRVLEDAYEELAASRGRSPRPLDLPRRAGFDPAVVDMSSPEREPPAGE